MLYLEVGGKKLHVPAGTTAQVEHRSALFTDGLEDSFSLPIELPVRGNEIVLGHNHQLPLRNRQTKFPGALLGHAGLPIHPGTLHTLASNDRTTRNTFVLEGFVEHLRGITLPQALAGNTIDLTDELVNQGISFASRPRYTDGGKCQFPMFFNKDLYGDANAAWYPGSTSPWSPSASYSANDEVEFTEYQDGVVRTSIWQCQLGGAGTGESPLTHPAKWKRAAYGIVNAWDRTSNQHYYNTSDGNFYSFVPWFYLKWVIQRAFAHVGYEVVGDFMDETRSHELVLANTTTIDAPSRNTNLNTFRVQQDSPFDFTWTGTPPNYDEGWQNFRLPGHLETPLPNQDPDSLWDNSAMEWTCPAAGTFRFRVKTTMNATRRRHAIILLIGPDDTIKARVGYTIPQEQWIAQGGLGENKPFQVEADLVVTCTGPEIGDAFHLVVVQTPNPNLVDPTGSISFPDANYSINRITDTTIIGWLEEAAPLVMVPDTEIHPERHVPDVELYGFIVAIADAFNLELRPDSSQRKLWLNFKERVFDRRRELTTFHSRRLVNPVEIDHQRATNGYRLKWDIPKHEESESDVMAAPRSVTENDLGFPTSTGQLRLVKTTNGVYKSIFKDGYFAFKHVGYHVPDTVIGDEAEATVNTPAVKPVHMRQLLLDGKHYVMPELNERGTSAWFHTEGERGTVWLSEYAPCRSHDNMVTNVPGARSWGYGWNASDTSSMTLLWENDDPELRGVYDTYWQQWLTFLTTAEPVTLDLLVDPAFLRSDDWRRIIHLHGQDYLIDRMPVEYGTHDGQLIAAGTYAYRIKDLTPVAVPPEDPTQFLFTSDKDGALSISVVTDSDYFTIRDQSGDEQTHPSGSATVFDPGGSNTRYHVWASDENGLPSGSVLSVSMDSQNITSFVPVSMEACQYMTLADNPDLPRFDSSGMSELQNISLAYCTSLTTLNVLPSPNLDTLVIRGCTALPGVNVTNNPLLVELSCDGCVLIDDLNLFYNPGLQVLNCSGLPLLTELDISNNPVIYWLEAQECAIVDVDSVILALDESIPDGILYLYGGSMGTPGGAAAAHVADLLANNWSVITN